jgi:hypothetical protein
MLTLSNISLRLESKSRTIHKQKQKKTQESSFNPNFYSQTQKSSKILQLFPFYRRPKPPKTKILFHLIKKIVSCRSRCFQARNSVLFSFPCQFLDIIKTQLTRTHHHRVIVCCCCPLLTNERQKFQIGIWSREKSDPHSFIDFLMTIRCGGEDKIRRGVLGALECL